MNLLAKLILKDFRVSFLYFFIQKRCWLTSPTSKSIEPKFLTFVPHSFVFFLKFPKIPLETKHFCSSSSFSYSLLKNILYPIFLAYFYNLLLITFTFMVQNSKTIKCFPIVIAQKFIHRQIHRFFFFFFHFSKQLFTIGLV